MNGKHKDWAIFKKSENKNLYLDDAYKELEIPKSIY